MKLRKILVLVFSLMLMLSAVPALAAEGNASATTVDVKLTDANSINSQAYIKVVITNNSSETIILSSVSCTSLRTLPGNLNLPSGVDEKLIAPGESYEVLLNATVSSNKTGSYTEMLNLEFTRVTVIEGTPPTVTPIDTFNINASVTLNFPELSSDNSNTLDSSFRLSAYDRSQKIVATPSGDAGDTIKIRVPLVCLWGPVVNISITPKLSTSLDEFPFDISQVDYTQRYSGGVETGEVIEFDYNLKLAKKVTAGVKKVDFIVTYTNLWGSDNTAKTATVSIYVNVINGYTVETPGTTPVVSQPKLILESYSFSTDKIYAGEEFELNFTLKNTSTVEAVQNIQISIADTADTGKLLPAENGSNTIYISKIEKGESYTVAYKMQSAADIDPKAYKLGLSLAYEGAKNVVAYTATDTISVTILQKVRLKFDTPVFYDECYVGSTCGAYLAMYNMGRSSVYNCMVSVEGDGLQMEETYFGGTVAAGSTMSADFNIITNTAGQIDGFIVVTYEDSLGEQMEERIPISLYVNDMGGMDGGVVDPGFEDPGIYEPGIDTGAGVSTGLPLWAWIAIGAGALGCAAAVLLVLKKRRNKQLEDV